MSEELSKDCYKVIVEGNSGEIVEKKSRFIANVKSVSSEEEAIAFIEESKKKYWDARHNCSAFIIGEKNELQRFSDDGEPSGTAGKPILEVLLGSGLRNVCVVVTRYFGGTLLGTGGLVRAYTQAANAGLAASKTAFCHKGKKINIKSDYNGIGKIQYIMAQMNIGQSDIQYTENVEISCAVKDAQVDELAKKVTEATAGKAEIIINNDIRFLQDDNNKITII